VGWRRGAGQWGPLVRHRVSCSRGKGGVGRRELGDAKGTRGVSVSPLPPNGTPFQTPGLNPRPPLNPSTLGAGEAHYAQFLRTASPQDQCPLSPAYQPPQPSPNALLRPQARPCPGAPGTPPPLPPSRARSASDSPSPLSPVDLSRHEDSADVTHRLAPSWTPTRMGLLRPLQVSH